MPFYEQVRKESFRPGDKILVVITRVDKDSKRGNFITVSRASTEFVKKLFEQESPELANGNVEIKRIARNPGSRTKIVVVSHADWVDSVGAVVGQRGLRVMMVRNELQGEQIDIIPWSDNEKEFAETVFTPVKPESISYEGEKVVAQIANESIPLVLGYRGQNLKLTGEVLEKNIDIVSENEGLVASYADGEVVVHKILDLGRDNKTDNKEKEDEEHNGEDEEHDGAEETKEQNIETINENSESSNEKEEVKQE